LVFVTGVTGAKVGGLRVNVKGEESVGSRQSVVGSGQWLVVGLWEGRGSILEESVISRQSSVSGLQFSVGLLLRFFWMVNVKV